MKHKCPNCGFEYDEFDIFCSRCGNKLRNDKTTPQRGKINSFVKNNPYKPDYKGQKKEYFPNFDNTKLFDGAVMKFAVVMLISAILMALSTNIVITKHKNEKQHLQYKNLISNPSLIPQLKDAQSFNSLALSFRKVQTFLLVYLKFSDDPKEKKEQIFASYLDQLDKIQNIQANNLENEFTSCNDLQNKKSLKTCNNELNRLLNPSGINAYIAQGEIYLYPDNKFNKKMYEKYFDSEFKKYINLKAKYNDPTSIGVNLYISPKTLQNKIADYEKLFLKTQNEYIKEKLERAIFDDTRKFIFTPSIYATTTQEMNKNFKNAYIHFISSKKNSALRPMILSVLDKQRDYGETNFKNDYPYKIFKTEDFNQNIDKNMFKDIFGQLRKNIFSDENANFLPTYIYNVREAKWKKYSPSYTLETNDYIISNPDENNNISIYNHMFSPIQEMNILKHSKLYLINDNLYVYNHDKLSISRITFNGKIFNLYNLTPSDITSLFPGVEIINMDSLANYDDYILKDNAKASYYIYSRYSQGWSDYELRPLNGEMGVMLLPNMFSVNTNNEITIAFKAKNEDEQNENKQGNDLTQNQTETTEPEISQNTPCYKFTISTRGQRAKEKKTADEKAVVQNIDEDSDIINHTPNIMPKIPTKEESQDNDLLPPKQSLEIPKEVE